MRRIPKNLFIIIAVMGTIGFSSCRSKIKTKTSSGPKAVAEDPNTEAVLTPDVLEVVGDKVYFQTRDVITIKVPKEFVGDGNVARVTNVMSPDGTTEEGEETELVTEQFLTHFGLAHDNSFNFTEEGDSVMWSFYPGEAGWAGKFHYCGSDPAKPVRNLIKVWVDDEVEPRYSVTELTLCDFDIFGVAVTSFENDVQVAEGPDFQFQGWVNILSNPVVYAADGSSLSTGIFNIVNPQ